MCGYPHINVDSVDVYVLLLLSRPWSRLPSDHSVYLRFAQISTRKRVFTCSNTRCSLIGHHSAECHVSESCFWCRKGTKSSGKPLLLMSFL